MKSAEVGNIDDAFEWSVSRLARCFGVHRQTVRKRLTDAGVVPSGVRNGSSVYHVRDAAPAILAPDMDATDPSAFSDPTRMHPSDRKDWYQSEQARVNLEKELRLLIPAEDVRREFARIAKDVGAILDQVPDTLERDAGVEPEQLERVERAIDSLREQLYQRVIEDDDSDG